MKLAISSIIFFTLFSLSTYAQTTPSASASKKSFDFSDGFIDVRGTSIQVINPSPNVLPDTTLLMITIAPKDSHSKMSMVDLTDQYALTMSAFLEEYSLRLASVPNIGYGIMIEGEGFLQNRYFTIPTSQLIRLDERDFGENDLMRDSEGETVISIREVLYASKLHTPGGAIIAAIDDPSFISSINNHDFGLVEAMIDKNHPNLENRNVPEVISGGQCKIDWINESEVYAGDFTGACSGKGFAGNYSAYNTTYTVSGTAGTVFGQDRDDTILRACGCY